MLALLAQIHKRLEQWPNDVLTVSLLGAAFVIACIALMDDNETLKALVLAYVVLP